MIIYYIIYYTVLDVIQELSGPRGLFHIVAGILCVGYLIGPTSQQGFDLVSDRRASKRLHLICI